MLDPGRPAPEPGCTTKGPGGGKGPEPPAQHEHGRHDIPPATRGHKTSTLRGIGRAGRRGETARTLAGSRDRGEPAGAACAAPYAQRREPPGEQSSTARSQDRGRSWPATGARQGSPGGSSHPAETSSTAGSARPAAGAARWGPSTGKLPHRGQDTSAGSARPAARAGPPRGRGASLEQPCMQVHALCRTVADMYIIM